MSVNSNERPTANELRNIFAFWYESIIGFKDEIEEVGCKGKEIKAFFEEADIEIPNISTSYKKDADAIYISRAFTFSKTLSNPINSSIITSYSINNEEINKGIFIKNNIF